VFENLNKLKDTKFSIWKAGVVIDHDRLIKICGYCETEKLKGGEIHRNQKNTSRHRECNKKKH